MQRQKRYSTGSIALLVLMAVSHSPLAETEMNFHGTLIEPPPCSINNGSNVFVEFGDNIGINKIDGENYRRPVDIEVTCEAGEGAGESLVLEFAGNQTSFDDSAVIATQQETGNSSDLGIRLYRDGVPVTFDTPAAVDPDNPPYIEAVPVKLEGATLTEGHFSAIATIRVEYR